MELKNHFEDFVPNSDYLVGVKVEGIFLIHVFTATNVSDRSDHGLSMNIFVPPKSCHINSLLYIMSIVLPKYIYEWLYMLMNFNIIFLNETGNLKQKLLQR